jgi:hypothetical protein
VTGERIRQLAILDDYVEQSVEEYRLITGLPLYVPDAPVVIPEQRGPRGRIRMTAKPETIQRLRELQEEASKFRGTAAHREAAELFMALVWYAHVSEKASLNALAKDLGIRRAALFSRLVRYGYMTSDCTTISYRPLKGRNPYQSKRTKCYKGHPFSEENTRINPANGHRICRTCERIRYQKRRARARALLGGET